MNRNNQTITNKSSLLALVITTLLFITPSYAHDENQIKELIKQELQRILNTKDALDLTIERGINRFIANQKATAEQARLDEQLAQSKELLPVDPHRDHILGNLNAPITLIEYSDFECPFCKRFHPNATQFWEDNSANLRWIYRHFPLDFHNPGAQKQAEASECVAELKGNDAFWEYIHAIYDRTESGGTGFPLENLRPLAEEINVNGQAFDECVKSERMAARVKEDYDNGVKVGISGTPAGYLMNRKGDVRFIAGALPIEQLQEMLDELSEK